MSTIDKDDVFDTGTFAEIDDLLKESIASARKLRAKIERDGKENYRIEDMLLAILEQNRQLVLEFIKIQIHYRMMNASYEKLMKIMGIK